jgi:hypothetical protein
MVEPDPSNPGKPLLVTVDMSWPIFKTQFQHFLDQTARVPRQLRLMLAPQFIEIQYQINENTKYVITAKLPKDENGNTVSDRYVIDGVRESIRQNGPAPMLQRTYSLDLADLINAIEGKLFNEGIPIGGGRRRKSRRHGRKRKTRRRN